MTTPRDLYIELLIRVLANTIYEDGGHRGGYRTEIRREGRDWPSLAHTMVGIARLNNLRDLMQRTIDEKIVGDYIETGVWRGGCCILMRGILAANLEPSRKVYVADSFEGLPPPHPDSFPVDEGSALHTVKELAIPIDQVRANFAKYDLLDDRVIFVKGFFKDTLPYLEPGPLALIRLDGDMYESTIQALASLYPRVSPGGFVIIDDYAVKGCNQAVADYRTEQNITDPLMRVDWTGAWWQKQPAIAEN